jgi:predicted RNA-binding Zn ribbon-like protein
MSARSDSGFPLVGEALPLDLINTRVQTPRGAEDLLTTPSALTAWLAEESARLPQPDGPLTSADVAEVQTLREHVSDAIDHGRRGKPPPARARRALRDAQRAAPAYRELQWSDTGVTAITQRDASYRARLCAELAEAAVELLASSAITAVRQCEGPDCVLLFLPAHPRRRWCSPRLCGNRVRVGRYYQRHKQS